MHKGLRGYGLRPSRQLDPLALMLGHRDFSIAITNEYYHMLVTQHLS